MTRVTPAGLARGGAVAAAGLAFPLVVTAPYLMTIAIFTVMYAALATSWNLLGGFSGYLSLGIASFFGLGAYAEAIIFTHIGIGSGYRPFAMVPVVAGPRSELKRSPYGVTVFTPSRVEIRTGSSAGTSPSSYRYRAKTRMPLPHISAAEPSALR